MPLVNFEVGCVGHVIVGWVCSEMIPNYWRKRLNTLLQPSDTTAWALLTIVWLVAIIGVWSAKRKKDE